MKKILTLSFAAFMMATMCTMAQEIKSGITIADMNPQMPAGEDFYEYAGGGWMKAHPLTAEYSRYGVFNELNEKNREQLKELFAQLAEGKQCSSQPGRNISSGNRPARDQQSDQGRVDSLIGRYSSASAGQSLLRYWSRW